MKLRSEKRTNSSLEVVMGSKLSAKTVVYLERSRKPELEFQNYTEICQFSLPSLVIMKEEMNKSSSKYKPSVLRNMADRERRRGRYQQKRRFRCNWNSACKALFLGLMLMFIGGSMATVGYFVDHIYKAADEATNDTINAIVREKSKLNINSVSTYVGPMIMGVGGFIVVAACVMTFEQRDNAAKVVVPNRLQIASTSGHGHSMNRHNKSSPSSRVPPTTTFREGSGRRHATTGSITVTGSQFGFSAYTASQEPAILDQFGRRELTADFIQFSRNLQQASLKKKFPKDQLIMSINRCPSAPDLVTAVDDGTSLRSAKSPLITKKTQRRVRNSLHPWMVSPRSLPRQALSMDTSSSSEYYRKITSLPGSKRVSRQASTSTAGKGSVESLESSSRRRKRSPKSSIDSRLQSPTFQENKLINESRIRERTQRSDTARRHLLIRQAPIELPPDDDGAISGGSSSLIDKYATHYEANKSSSTPHSRRESYSPRVPSVDGSPRFRQLDYSTAIVAATLRCSSPTLRHASPTGRYLRSNTVSHEMGYRRDSNTFDVCSRKGSADYNYRSRRRKSSNTSDSSSRYCSRMNVQDATPGRFVNNISNSSNTVRRDSKSPTPSLKSFQEATFNRNEKLNRVVHRANTGSSTRSSKDGKRSNRNYVESSLSPDSLSVSSTATEGHSRADPVSIEIDDDSHQDNKAAQ